MPKFTFNKLVRDTILDQQLAAGSKPKWRTLGKEEHLKELIKKLNEEAAEIAAAAPREAASEIADVQQVLDDIAGLLGVDPKSVRREQDRKFQKSGAFKKGIFIEDVDVAEDDPWAAYYRKHADRYPEIK